MSKVKLNVEYKDSYFWGWIDTDKSSHVISGHGDTLESMLQNVIDSIRDYIANEGAKDKYFSKLDLSKINFTVEYDLRAFLNEYKFINFAAIGSKYGLNADLISQYKTGKKKASTSQVKKIESVIHDVGKKLTEVQMA